MSQKTDRPKNSKQRVSAMDTMSKHIQNYFLVGAQPSSSCSIARHLVGKMEININIYIYNIYDPLLICSSRSAHPSSQAKLPRVAKIRGEACRDNIF